MQHRPETSDWIAAGSQSRVDVDDEFASPDLFVGWRGSQSQRCPCRFVADGTGCGMDALDFAALVRKSYQESAQSIGAEHREITMGNCDAKL